MVLQVHLTLEFQSKFVTKTVRILVLTDRRTDEATKERTYPHIEMLERILKGTERGKVWENIKYYRAHK